MNRFAMKITIVQTLVQTIILINHHCHINGFILRSPLYMSNSNGENQLDITSKSSSSTTTPSSFDELSSQGKKTSLSISTTSPSPLAPTTTESKERRNKSTNNNRQRIYRENSRSNYSSSLLSSTSPSSSSNKVKKINTPLVDSTLLRFLSAQKSQLAAQEQTLKYNEVSNSNDIRSDSNSSNNDVGLDDDDDDDDNYNDDKNTINDKKDDVVDESQSNVKSITEHKSSMDDTSNQLIKSMTKNLMLMEETKDNATMMEEAGVTQAKINSREGGTTRQQVKDTTADSISWFTQYSEQNVARKLIALGAAKGAAQEAGKVVQNYSLTRTTRQRVRKFLSERDSILALSSKSIFDDQSSGSSSSSKGGKMLASNFDFDDSANYSYNIDNVIDVLTDAGLTGNDISTIFSHTPSVSMMQTRLGNNGRNTENVDKSNYLEDSLDRAFHDVLCTTIKLRKYDARKVLRSCPGLLTKRGSTSSSEVISILSNLGVAPTSLCRDKAALPLLLSRSPASLFRLVAFISSDAVRMPVNRIGQLIRKSECARLLDYVAPLTQKPNIDSSLDVVTFFNSGSNAMETEITRRYKAMFRTAKYLRREVGIQDLGRSISAYPNILTLDIENQIALCVEFLYEEVELFEDEIPRVLELHPQLLGANITAMRENLDYFRSLEVVEDELGSIFRSFPSLLIMDIEKMSKVVNFLKEVGVTNIGRFVTRLPPVLGYSVENDLRPKWKYLTQVRHYASFEISRFPAYFSYPLDRVIKCRYEYLQDVKKLPVKYFPIDEVLRYGDRDFAIVVAKDDDETNYLTFATEMKKKQQKRKGRPKSSKKKNIVKGDIR